MYLKNLFLKAKHHMKIITQDPLTNKAFEQKFADPTAKNKHSKAPIKQLSKLVPKGHKQ
jgi:hypothetical protein